MKKTQLIELFNNIKSTLVSFISITIFVCLGVAVYTGFSWTSNAIIENADNNLNETKFHDIQILFPYGVNEQDINNLKQIEGVDEIECSYSAYAYFELEDVSYQAKIIQLHNVIDLPFDIEGELPNKYDEIILDKNFAKTHNIKIGDEISFVGDNDGFSRSIASIINYEKDSDINGIDFSNDDKMAYLKTDRYKVKALASSSEFLNTNKNNYGISPINKMTLDCFIYMREDGFDESSFGGYTEILIRSDELRKYSLDDKEYTEVANKIVDDINDNLLHSLLEEKNDTMRDSIASIGLLSESKLEETKKEIEESEKLIIDGKAELSTKRDELNEALKKLEDSEALLANAQSQYSSQNEQFVYAQNIRDGLSSVSNASNNDIRSNFDDYLSKIDQGISFADANGLIDASSALV